jgi:hypothetical protein
MRQASLSGQARAQAAALPKVRRSSMKASLNLLRNKRFIFNKLQFEEKGNPGRSIAYVIDYQLLNNFESLFPLTGNTALGRL